MDSAEVQRNAVVAEAQSALAELRMTVARAMHEIAHSIVMEELSLRGTSGSPLLPWQLCALAIMRRKARRPITCSGRSIWAYYRTAP